MKKPMLVVILVLAFAMIYAFAQNGPVGSSFGWIGTSKCQDPGPNIAALCLQSDGQLKQTNNGAAYGDPTNFKTGGSAVTSVFGRTGAVAQQTGDYNFQQIAGQIVAGQLPATTTCTISISNFAQDGKGGASGTAVYSACH
jgi:hypothetical protein